MHVLTPAQVRELSARAEASGLSERAKERLGWIVHFLTHDQSIFDTCVVFGVSRSTFCRWLERFDPNDLASLEERSHEPNTVRQPTVPADVVEWIRGYRTASPLTGKERIAELLLAEHGVEISASSVGRVIDRECLYFADTPLHWKKRMRMSGQRAAGSGQPTGEKADETMIERSRIGCSRPHCVWCRLSRWDWQSLGRAAVIASLVTNVAVIALLLSSALWESRVATTTLNASVGAQSSAASSPLPLP
jgi:transposase